ncbi:hypothetical protein [Ruania albidiflava]|uniref:hypothetical protein n=1 Tax=Ruania albidiflava TaxID=366586 RepID=UPI0003B71E6D|nr:hypothetical protein [Ruania albidiflava]
MTGEEPAALPRPRWRRVAATALVVLAVAAVVLGGLRYLPVLISGSTEAHPVPTPVVTQVPQPTASTPEVSGGDAPFTADRFLATLNQALAEVDRQAFFAQVGPGAADGANLWWDNMMALGMSGGGLSVESGTLESLGPGGSADLTIRLGAITPGTPQAGATTDYAEAGDYLLAAAQYRITVSVTPGGEGQITGWQTTEPVKPWDAGPLRASHTDHVLVAVADSEAHLLEELGGELEEPASWVLQRYADATGRAPVDRFTVFLTEDEDRAGTWFDTGGSNEQLAGFTIPLLRLEPAPGLDPQIATEPATGAATPWGSSVVTVGPEGLTSTEALRSLAAHELTHAVAFAWLPVPENRSRVVSEGWAEYSQELWDSDGSFAPPGSWRAERITECLADGWDYPTDADFDTPGEEILCAYALSASVYGYAETIGLDPFELARRARSTGASLGEVSRQLDGRPLTQEGWADWVGSTYG